MEGSAAEGAGRRFSLFLVLLSLVTAVSAAMLLRPQVARHLETVSTALKEGGFGAGFEVALRSEVLLWLLLPVLVPLLGALFALFSGSSRRASPVVAGGPAPVAALPPVDRQGLAQGGALKLLAVLQEEARLIDFVQENIEGYDDAEVGAAARAVHAGLRKALAARVRLVPLHEGEEGVAVEIPPGFDPERLRVSGHPRGNPPWHGVLVHPGWQALEIRLPVPTEGADASLLAPAEVEVPEGKGGA